MTADEPKVTFRRRPDGELEPDDAREPTDAHTEARTKPEVGDDPRPPAVRNVPHYGAGQ